MTAIVRPNGRVYRPRNAPWAVQVSDIEDSDAYVLVFGTHDIEAARAIAQPAAAAYLIDAHTGWQRLAMRHGDQVYVDDEVRGAACVIFTESDSPERTMR